MIYYFSGTGNSKWIAQMMAELTDDQAISITAPLVSINEQSKKGRKDITGIIFPIYAWETPSIMKAFIKDYLLEKIKENEKENDHYCYCVATCGGDTGLAVEKLEKLVHLDGKFSIVMPDNYIVMFDSEKEERITKKLRDAKLTVEIISNYVLQKRQKTMLKNGSFAGLKTNLTSHIFDFFLSDKPFYAEESCLNCGLCQSKCPLGNIEMVDKKPRWKGNCIHCMACISYCPTEAIQFGRKTIHRKRYNCEGALEEYDI